MRRNNNTLLIAFLLILLMGIGYAILSSTLNINGITNISATSWDVHFENVAATSESNTTPTVAPSAPATSKVTTLTYEVTLNNPGDIYEFTVDVTNDGTIDAMIDSVDSKIKIGSGSWQTVSNSTIPDYLLYDVIYSNGMPIKQANSLKAGESKELLVHAEYKKDVTEEQLAEASNKTISFKVTINYKQADGTEEEPAYDIPIKYTNKSRNYVFQETPPDTTTYLGLYSDGQYGVCLKLNENQYCYKNNNYVLEKTHLNNDFSLVNGSCQMTNEGISFDCNIDVDVVDNRGCFVDQNGIANCYDYNHNNFIFRYDLCSVTSDNSMLCTQ